MKQQMTQNVSLMKQICFLKKNSTDFDEKRTCALRQFSVSQQVNYSIDTTVPLLFSPQSQVQHIDNVEYVLPLLT